MTEKGPAEAGPKAIVARREHDEGDVAPVGSLFDALARVLTGQSRHDEVEQNTVHRLNRE
jgi:hypothetical protein